MSSQAGSHGMYVVEAKTLQFGAFLVSAFWKLIRQLPKEPDWRCDGEKSCVSYNTSDKLVLMIFVYL